jgi:hypothetical protein
LAPETETQKQLTELQQRIKHLEEQSQQEKPEGDFVLQIGSQTFEPNMFKIGAGFGVRYLFFQLQSNNGYDQVMDDLTAKVVQETTYMENGELVLRGRTVEIWQDLRHNEFWWAKVEVDAFS